MSPLIYAGQALQAGQQQGQLSQYYGYADVNQTTVASAAQANLSTAYAIPAGEADYADVAYEMECGGQGTWGTTQQALTLAMYIGSAFGSGAIAAAGSLAAGASFTWSARMRLTCSDGVSAWWAKLEAFIQENTNPVLPGTAADNSVTLVSTNSSPHAAAVSSPVTVAVQAKWNSATGGPTLTNYMTWFRKIA